MRKFTGPPIPPHYSPSSHPPQQPVYGGPLSSPSSSQPLPPNNPQPPPPLPPPLPSSSSSSSANTSGSTISSPIMQHKHQNYPQQHNGLPESSAGASYRPVVLPSPMSSPLSSTSSSSSHTVNISVELKKYEKLIFPTNNNLSSSSASSSNPPPFALIIDERTGQVSRTVQLINNNTAALVTPVVQNSNAPTISSSSSVYSSSSVPSPSSTVYYSQPSLPRFGAVTNNHTVIPSPSGNSSSATTTHMVYPPTVSIPHSYSTQPHLPDNNNNNIQASPLSSSTITYYTAGSSSNLSPNTASATIINPNVSHPSYYTVDNQGNLVPISVMYSNGNNGTVGYPLSMSSSASHASLSYYSTAPLPSSVATTTGGSQLHMNVNSNYNQQQQPIYFTPVMMNSASPYPQQPPLPPSTDNSNPYYSTNNMNTVYNTSTTSNNEGSRSAKSSNSQHSNPHTGINHPTLSTSSSTIDRPRTGNSYASTISNTFDSSADSSVGLDSTGRKTSSATNASVPVEHKNTNTNDVNNNPSVTKATIMTVPKGPVGTPTAVTSTTNTVYPKGEPVVPAPLVVDLPVYIIPRLISRENTWSIVENDPSKKLMKLSANLIIDIPTSTEKESISVTDRLRIRQDYRYIVVFRQSPYVNSNYASFDHKFLTGISIQKQLEIIENKRINASYDVNLSLTKNKNNNSKNKEKTTKATTATETTDRLDEPVENLWITTVNNELSLQNTPYSLSTVPFTLVESKDTETTDPNLSITAQNISADYGRRCELIVLGIPLSFTLSSPSTNDNKKDKDGSKNEQSKLPLLRSDNRLPVYVLGESVPYFTPSTVPEAPTGLGSIKETKTSIKVKWNLPEERGNMCFKYLLEMTESSSSTNETETNFTWGTIYEGSERSFEHKGLQPGRRYAYRVCGVNSNGSSPWSSTFFAWTESSVPTTPSAPSCGLCTPTTMQINWISSPESDIQEYVLEMAEGSPSTEYQTSKRSHGLNFQIVYRGNRTTHTLTDLVPEHTYSVRLTARNQVGPSEPSTIVSYTSTGAVPSPPSKLTIETEYIVKNIEPSDPVIPLSLSLILHQQYDIPMTLHNDLKVSWIGITGGNNGTVGGTKKGTNGKGWMNNKDPTHSEPLIYVVQLAFCKVDPPKNKSNTKSGKDKYTITLGTDTETFEITDQTWYTFHNLVPATVYKVRVATKNKNGMSEFTEWITFVTIGSAPDPIHTLHAECLPVEENVTSPKPKGVAMSGKNSHAFTHPYGQLYKVQIFCPLPSTTHGSDIHEYNVQVRHRSDDHQLLMDEKQVQHYLRHQSFLHVQNGASVTTLDSFDSGLPLSALEKRSLPVHPPHAIVDTPIILHSPDQDVLSVFTVSSTTNISSSSTKENQGENVVPTIMDKVKAMYQPNDDVDVLYEVDRRWYTGKLTSIDEELSVLRITLVLGIAITLPVVTEDDLRINLRKRYSKGQKVSVDLQNNENYRFLGEVKTVNAEGYTVTIVGTTVSESSSTTNGTLTGSNEMEIQLPTAQIGDESDTTPSIVSMQLARAAGSNNPTVSKLTNWKDAVLTKNATKPKPTVTVGKATVSTVSQSSSTTVKNSQSSPETSTAISPLDNPILAIASNNNATSTIPTLPEWYTSLLPLHSSDSLEWFNICSLSHQDTMIDFHPLTRLPCTKFTIPSAVFLPGHTYELRISAKNYYGKSSYSPSPYAITVPSNVPLPPSLVTIVSPTVTETSMNIHVVPPIEDGGETIIGYVIQIADGLSSSSSNNWKTVHNGSLTILSSSENVLSHTLNNLLPGRPYYVRVAAMNKHGISTMRIATSENDESMVAVTKTKGKAPSVPTKIKSSWITPRQIPPILFNENARQDISKILLGTYHRVNYSTVMITSPDPLNTTVPSINDMLSTWASVFSIDWHPPTEDYGESVLGYDVSVSIVDTVTNDLQNTTFTKIRVQKSTTEPEYSVVSQQTDSSSVYQGPVPQILLGAFTPGVSYSIRIRAYNRYHKYSVWSTPIIITAPVDIPSSLESSFLISPSDGVTHASIRLQWNTLNKQQLGYGNIVAYNIQRIKLPDNTEFSSSINTSATINESKIYTFSSLPTLMENIRIDGNPTSTALVSSIVKGCINSRLAPDSTNTNGTKVGKLLPNTWYGFRVSVENEIGTGPYTSWILVRTHFAPLVTDTKENTVVDTDIKVVSTTVASNILTDSPQVSVIPDNTAMETVGKNIDGVRHRKPPPPKKSIGKITETEYNPSLSDNVIKVPETPVQVLSPEEFHAHLKEKKRKAQFEIKQNQLKKHGTIWERNPWLGRGLLLAFVVLTLGFIIYGLWLLENNNSTVTASNLSRESTNNHHHQQDTPKVPRQGPR